MNREPDLDRIDRGYATGGVQQLLRVEALAIFAASATLFFSLGGELWIFAVLFFAPDLSLAGYAVSRKAGAALYNAVHGYAMPAVMAIVGVLTGLTILWHLALIFAAHAAFDRSLGYGLKYAAGFRHTHLGPIGKPST